MHEVFVCQSATVKHAEHRLSAWPWAAAKDRSVHAATKHWWPLGHTFERPAGPSHTHIFMCIPQASTLSMAICLQTQQHTEPSSVI